MHFGSPRFSRTVLLLIPFVILLPANAFCQDLGKQLLAACWQDNKAEIERLLDQGADINTSDKQGGGNTPLSVAAFRGQIEIVKLLLSRGANVNIGTPLAAASRHLEIARLLLEHGADVNGIDGMKRTALFSACTAGNLRVCELLLSHKADVNWKDFAGETPLWFARDQEVMKFLIARGADVNARDKSGNTVINREFPDDNPEIIALLIKSGVDFRSRKRSNGASPLLQASAKGYAGTLKVLLENGADPNDRYTFEGMRTPGSRNENMVVVGESAPQPVSPGDNSYRPASMRVTADKMTALMAASQGGYTDVVSILLKKGAEVNATDSRGSTALMEAASAGSIPVLKELLEAGAQVNHTNSIGQNALTCASRYNHYDAVKLLLSKGAKGSEGGDSALITASATGSVDLARELLKASDINARSGITGNTALLIASSKGNIELSRLLIENGADIEIRNNNNDTPLTAAAKEGHLGTVNLLLEKGALVESRDKEGNTALILAAAADKTEVVNTIARKGADLNTRNQNGSTALKRAADSGHIEAVRTLVKLGADINSGDNSGQTPLMGALAYGKTDAAKFLVQAGADVNAASASGTTAIMVSQGSILSEMGRMLLEKGASIDARDNEGKTALIRFASQPPLKFATIKNLLDWGADVNAKSKQGLTALMAATSAGQPENVKLLLEGGADVNSANQGGETALHAACRRGDAQSFNMLIAAGADFRVQNAEGISPLMIACQHGWEELTTALLEFGADPGVRDKHGRTALFHVGTRNDMQLITLLLKKGADINTVDNSGIRPVFLAVSPGIGSRRLAVLIDAGADFKTTNPLTGGTPLMAAAVNGNVEAVKLLLEKGADPNAVDIRGSSALAMASNPLIRKMLQEHGAKDIRSEDDRSLIGLLKKFGFDFRGREDSLTAKDIEGLRLMLKMQLGEDYLKRIGHSDARLSSPESTWNLHKSSLLQGDFETALRCFAVESRDRYAAIYKKVPKDAIQKSAEEMQPITRVRGDDRQAQYVTSRVENGRKIEYGVRFINVFGEWLIIGY